MDLLALTLIPSLQSGLNILYVALGLGLVIFIHELGHFLVAKWCGVKVERFSIGFGPILWKVTRGETEYALSAIPFGGYVKMLGQDDADPSQMANERIARDPRSYTAKSVPQRMAIISAGVINNMVSAVMFFVIAFMFGVKYQPAVVGQVTPGMPAWEAGLRLGDRITRINNRVDRQLGFIDVRQAVALSKHEENLVIEGERDGKPFSTTVRPQVSDEQLFPTISIEPEQGLSLADSKADPPKGNPTVPGLSAAAAEPAFEYGDTIVSLDGTELNGYAQLQKLLAAKRDQTVEIGIRRKGEPKDGSLTQISVAPNHFRTLGLKMAIGRIKAIQRGSPAEKDLRVGDTITQITGDDGKVLRVGADIDPLRLPDYFAARAGQRVNIKVKREVQGGNPVSESIDLVPDDRAGWIERPDSVNDCPLSIPAIGVAFHVLHHIVDVEEGGPAATAGILKDDNLVKIEYILPEGAEPDGYDTKSLPVTFSEKDRNWPKAFWLIQGLPQRTIRLTVKSLGATEEKTVDIVPEAAEDWYLPMRGFLLQPLLKTRQAASLGEAISLGFHHTRDSIVDMWLTIGGLTSGRINPKALGGPIRIAGTAYYFTKQGIPDLILFLGMLSVSLAVLNFLPIPVLDGGHFMFLCWEGIRGKPPSDWVVVTATYVGLAMVLSLMAWVMYMDISGLIG